MSRILPKSFYLDQDVVSLSQSLLGKWLFTEFDEGRAGGIISETEAYRGPEDRASHAFGNRRTKRTEVMFLEGGRAYIYLCYGIHHLLNVVTNIEGVPHAVLIRALIPQVGLDLMARRRNKRPDFKGLTKGPGALSQALGITTEWNGALLTKPPIWIEDRGIDVPSSAIEASKRVGIDYAGEDAHLPWRFTLSKHFTDSLTKPG